MQRKYLSIAIGLFLSAGLAIAQAPAQNQPDQQAPAAQSGQQPLAGENAPSQQQGERPHAQNPARMAHRLGRELGLTQDQIQQLKPILANRQQQMMSLRSDSTLSDQDRRAKAHSIMHDSRTQIEALLNDTQKQQYEQMLAQRRAQHQHNSAPQAQ